MGQVYRADDLTLDQTVAAKFLPEEVAADPARLAQLHNELRVARQVSHKKCRLNDLGEADGRRFLTIEYVGRRGSCLAAPPYRPLPGGPRARAAALRRGGRAHELGFYAARAGQPRFGKIDG